MASIRLANTEATSFPFIIVSLFISLTRPLQWTVHRLAVHSRKGVPLEKRSDFENCNLKQKNHFIFRHRHWTGPEIRECTSLGAAHIIRDDYQGQQSGRSICKFVCSHHPPCCFI